MNLFALLDAAGIERAGYDDGEVTMLAADAQTVTKGGMFFCLRGLRESGLRFLPEALSRGAGWILTDVDTALPGGIPARVIRVADARRAMAFIYSEWYGNPANGCDVIGVTGTNGKTTVTTLIRQILEADGSRVGLIGTAGNFLGEKEMNVRSGNPLANMTTPDPPELYRLLREMRDGGAERIVAEISSHALALEKTAPIRYRAAIFTNLTPEHLDFHKTMDTYAEAKAKLFRQSDCAILNSDSPFAEKMRGVCTGRVVTCSASGKDAEYLATDLDDDASGMRFTLRHKEKSMRVKTTLNGFFNVMNALQAAVCALELGVPEHTVRNSLACARGAAGRMERVDLGKDADFTVLIDYAHTPDALESVLRSLRETKKDGRIVLLFGCGGDRDREKRPVMGRIGAELADRLILTSDNPRSEDPDAIIEEIRRGIPDGADLTVTRDRRDAIRYAIGSAQPGDVILLAGKGHETYEIGRSGKKPFFEKEIVREAYRLRKRENRPE